MATKEFTVKNVGGSLPERYCSCIFKANANLYERNYEGNPYGICSKSVFNSRGMQGPGRVKCKYTREYLDSLSDRYLYNYALSKKIIRYEDDYDHQDLVDLIFEYLQKYSSVPSVPSVGEETEKNFIRSRGSTSQSPKRYVDYNQQKENLRYMNGFYGKRYPIPLKLTLSDEDYEYLANLPREPTTTPLSPRLSYQML